MCRIICTKIYCDAIIIAILYSFAINIGIPFTNLAAPISYFLMTDWLNEFSFHTDLGLGILAMAGIASVLIAWLTVSYQSIRAATANPVVSLRSE